VENHVKASHEELQALVVALQMEIAALRAEVARLQEENLRLRQGGGGTPVVVKPNRKPREKKKRKHRQQSFVRRREQPDEVHYHAMTCCPDCGRKLAGGWEHGRRQVIEIELPRVRVVEHVLLRRRCGVCQKTWLPQTSAAEFGAVGKRRMGVGIQSLVALLHIAYRIPMRRVRRMLAELWGLQISTGEVVKLLAGTAQAGKAEVQRLLEQVRGSPAVCADETGWREDGENGYLWTFSTPSIRYFVYDRSRAGAIPKEVLGEEFTGVTVSDFYAAYNKVEGVHQRCWVHLLRDLKALAEANADRAEVVAWVETVKQVYQEAKDFSHPHLRERQRQQRRCMQAATKLAAPYAKDAQAPQRVLAKRIIKHIGELFVFVRDPHVPADNNLAERSLRPSVIARKISGGTRSKKGSETKTALMSLFGTWSAQDKHLLRSCQQLLLPSPV
jgi:hypothetical protein